MWPKVFAQLVELLPHVSRLVPMADRFFAQKNATDKANEAAITTLAATVRTDLGQVTAAHSGLYREIQAQSAQIAEVAADSKRTRVSVESVADRTAALERQLAALGLWLKTGVALIVAALALLIAIFVLAARAK